MATVAAKGIPNASKNASCKTIAARNNLIEAPRVCDTRKNIAPVFYATGPNLLSRKV